MLGGPVQAEPELWSRLAVNNIHQENCADHPEEQRVHEMLPRNGKF